MKHTAIRMHFINQHFYVFRIDIGRDAMPEVKDVTGMVAVTIEQIGRAHV